MTDAELLANIVEAPDDDAPREVYADWLTERGDPRGEMIVLQLQRARGGGHADKSERERDLFDAHGDAWLGALAGFGKEWTFGWRRGFVDGAYYEGETPKLGLDALARSAPIVRRLHLDVPARALDAALALVAATPLPALAELHLRSRVPEQHGIEPAIDLSRALPRLALIAGENIGALRVVHPSLRELRFEGRTRITGELPAVERLVVDARGGRLITIKQLGTWPSLKSLRIAGAQSVGGGIAKWCADQPRLELVEVDTLGDSDRERLEALPRITVKTFR